MKRKRKLNTGVQPIGGAAIKSLRIARLVTSKFHNLKQQLCHLNVQDDSTNDKQKIEAMLEQLEERYQQASQVSTQRHKTARWVIRCGQLLGMNNNDVKTKVLEIGAVNNQLKKCEWMIVRAIDLHSQNPDIEEMDFFNLQPREEYDILVSSMVLNFVPDPFKRGEMLIRMVLHLRPGGLLCLVLPRRCVASPLVGLHALQQLFTSIQLEEAMPVRLTPKLAFFVLRRTVPNSIPANVSSSRSISSDELHSNDMTALPCQKNRKRQKVSPANFAIEIESLDSQSVVFSTRASQLLSQIPNNLRSLFCNKIDTQSTIIHPLFSILMPENF